MELTHEKGIGFVDSGVDGTRAGGITFRRRGEYHPIFGACNTMDIAVLF